MPTTAILVDGAYFLKRYRWTYGRDHGPPLVAKNLFTMSIEHLDVLVTGDADFVPAAKFARREGIDVVLDPMWQPISQDLQEHIDGLKSVCPKPTAS